MLHATFVHMLFVGFAHNLLLESYVSRKAQVERIHLNVGAETLDHLFMYRARQTEARAARLGSDMRSAAGGGKRPEAQARAAAGKGLTGSANRSRFQQRTLMQQTDAAGACLSTKRLLKRRAGGIASKRKQARAACVAAQQALTSRTLDSLAATCVEPRRTKPLTVAACGRLIADVPEPGSVIKKARGNIFKDQATIAAGKQVLAAGRKTAAAAKAVQARSKPLRADARRRAESLPAGVAVGMHAAKRKAAEQAGSSKRQRPQRAAAAAAALAAEDHAYSEESDGEE